MTSQAKRADRAGRMIRSYAGKTDFNVQVVVGELLCDIIVCCQLEDANFREILRRALQIRASEHLEARLKPEAEFL